MIRQAIVRQVPDSYTQCISSASDAAAIDVNRARAQHAGYVELLRELGLEVHVLPALEEHPDCIFTEDTAIVIGDTVLACNLWQSGARRGEETTVLPWFEGRTVHRVEAPASLEGGDVLRWRDRIHVGVSGRSNPAGVEVVRAAFPGHDVRPVPVSGTLHLKTGTTIAGGRLILAAPGHADLDLLPALPSFTVPAAEAHGANCVNINDVVLLPDDCPATAAAVREQGLEVRTLAMSEFRKADGSLTCLSIRY